MSYMHHTFNVNKHQMFNPKFPEKYVGKHLPIIRSSWERMFCQWCDATSSVVQWNSEEVAIPYYDPVRRKTRRYYPDFMMKIRDKKGNDTIYIVEVKPYKEVQAPQNLNRKKQKTMLYEMSTYATNMAKWKAADIYCKKRGIIFKIITEKELFS